MINKNGMCDDGSVNSFTRGFYSYKMYAMLHYRKSPTTVS